MRRFDLLDAGEIDVAIGMPPTRPDQRIFTRRVLSGEFATIVSKDDAAARRGMSMKTFLAHNHVLALPEGDGMDWSMRRWLLFTECK